MAGIGTAFRRFYPPDRVRLPLLPSKRALFSSGDYVATAMGRMLVACQKDRPIRGYEQSGLDRLRHDLRAWVSSYKDVLCREGDGLKLLRRQSLAPNAALLCKKLNT